MHSHADFNAIQSSIESLAVAVHEYHSTMTVCLASTMAAIENLRRQISLIFPLIDDTPPPPPPAPLPAPQLLVVFIPNILPPQQLRQHHHNIIPTQLQQQLSLSLPSAHVVPLVPSSTHVPDSSSVRHPQTPEMSLSQYPLYHVTQFAPVVSFLFGLIVRGLVTVFDRRW
ncbi:UNVERIFIED_CONTAM: hypothetical protein Sradi_0668600 [Sesamum radiatum]|uniref:Uncharacterized protein n=1 Tax=Sesamum radiatum TaxID=300843 RepID=A0AAW2VPT0_SESRA